MKNVLIIASISALICACSGPRETAAAPGPSTVPPALPPTGTAEQAPVQGQPERLILGDWVWLKTICCGRTPSTETPETMGVARMLRFTNDGSVQFLSGGETMSTHTYKITYDLGQDRRPAISIGPSRPGLLHFTGDTLVIDYGYVDLQQEFYGRVK